MKITCNKATAGDIEQIYQLCKKLIDDYENIDSIDYDRVLKWVHMGALLHRRIFPIRDGSI